MTAYPIITFIQSCAKFQSMDSEIQMKDFIAYFYIFYFCLTSEVKVVKRKNDGIPYIDIHSKCY